PDHAALPSFPTRRSSDLVGSGVATVRRGDRVVLPFNVACGFCGNCRTGKSAFCLTVNPPGAGGAYGYVGMGPYTGGQAEYLRVRSEEHTSELQSRFDLVC